MYPIVMAKMREKALQQSETEHAEIVILHKAGLSERKISAKISKEDSNASCNILLKLKIVEITPT